MERKSNKSTIGAVIAIVIVALLGVAAYAFTMNQSASDNAAETESNTTDTTNSDEQPQTDVGDDEAEAKTTIVFTDDGFSPTTYTSKAGEPVTVENRSSMDLQFSSDDHPTHTEQTELNLAVLAPGKSATFTPTKVGEWMFHDHLNDQFTGTLTVKE